MLEKISKWLVARPLRGLAAIVLTMLVATCGVGLGGLVLVDNVAPSAPAKLAPHILGSFIPVAPGQSPGPIYNNGGNLTTNTGNFDSFRVGREPVVASGQIDAGQCATMYVDPSQVVPGEAVADDGFVEVRILGDVTNTPYFVKIEFLGAGNGATGQVLTSDGGPYGVATLSPQFPASLIDASVQWVQPDAGLLAIQVCSPGTATTYAVASLSEVHALPQYQGTNSTLLDAGGHYVLQPYPSSFSPIVDSGTGGLTFTIPSTYFDMGTASGGSIGPWACNPFTSYDGHLAYCTLPNGIYDAGAGDASLTVAVTTQTGLLTSCPGCVTLAGGLIAGSITSTMPNADSALGGATVLATLPAGTCTGSPTATVNGVSATGVTCPDTSHAQFTNPAYSSTAGTNTVQTVIVTTSTAVLTGSTTASGMRFTAAGSCAVSGRWHGNSLAGGVWASWPDISGGAHALAATASPTTTTVNGLISPTFNGTSQYASTASAICGASSNVSIVAGMQYLSAGATQQGYAQVSSTSGYSTTLGEYSGQPQVSDTIAGTIRNGGFANNLFYVIGGINNAASSTLQQTTTQYGGSLTAQGATENGMKIGSAAGFADGAIMEVEVWCCAITTTELNEAVNVVRTTWATQ